MDSVKGKPLHKWQYKGRVPEGELGAGWSLYECERCGFALISFNSLPPARNIQRLISENANLKRCETIMRGM